jgi:hypothetical protein
MMLTVLLDRNPSLIFYDKNCDFVAYTKRARMPRIPYSRRERAKEISTSCRIRNGALAIIESLSINT